ncbi:MAG: hypothetical protein K0Q93_3046, partial [Nocardioidaceae bacterium]|nr:hypothetical protein [Nocardioidaceae bacterium]
PNYERYEYPGLAGKPYQFTHNPKGCMHTTEGGSISGAMSAYAPYPPHLIYDWRNRRGVQHVRLDRAAYSAMDGNDDDYMIQVELVGFAAETRNWPEEALRNVAIDVVAPLEQYFKIPRRIIWHGFKDGRDGITLAVANSPIRLDWTQLRDFSGWLGHQHLPSPDTHWDPGALPMARIFSYLTEEPDMNEAQNNALADVYKVVVSGEKRNGQINKDLAFVRETVLAQVSGLQAAVSLLAAKVGEADGADAAEIEAAVAKAIRENTLRVDIDVSGTDTTPTT